MARRGRARVAVAVAVVVAGSLLVSGATHAGAQTPPPSSVPTPHIIPRPNSGHEPTDAGDRGGALQLLVLGALVVAVSGAAAHLVVQSRRARASRPD